MSTNLRSAMTFALLTASCMTAFAEPYDAVDDEAGFVQAVGRNGSHSMHPNAPIATGQFADDDALGYTQLVGRNGSHSMHPNAPVTAEHFAGDDVEVLQPTETQ